MREKLVVHQVVAPAVERALRLRPRRDGRPAAGGAPLEVRVLLLDAFLMDGTNRTVLNLAGHLARTRRVEIVSLLRRDDEPFFDFPPGVTVKVLHDVRPGARRHPLDRLPSALMHPDEVAYDRYSLLSDAKLLRWLRGLGPSVVIATRPGLNAFLARYAPPRVVAVGQEHMDVGSHRPELRREIEATYGGLDALAVLSVDAQRNYERALDGIGTPIERIPNALPAVPGAIADERAPVIVSAGRLVDPKGFDLLVDAFARIADRHPEWSVHVYGEGVGRPGLERRIAEHGLERRFVLEGATSELGAVLGRAAIFAMSSRKEGFPMVLLEAMSKGCAVVSFDCPSGPAEIITDGEDGLLVPAEDVGALAETLSSLIADRARRERIARAGLDRAADFSIDVVGARWDALLP